MSILTFSGQCPFTENTPLFLLGVPGIFLILVVAFFLDLHLHNPNFVPTISHTARQEQISFFFGWYAIIQIEFLAFCAANLGLIMMYVAGFILLLIIVTCNPPPKPPNSPTDPSPKARLTHQVTAGILFVYVLVVGILCVVLPIGAFDSTNTDSSLTVKRLSVVLMILLILSFGGMFYIMLVLNNKEDEKWSEPVSYLERLFMLIFFTITLLVPKGTLV